MPTTGARVGLPLRIALAVMFVVALSTVGETRFECILTPYSFDMSFVDYFRMQASTNKNDCGSREVEVRGWIQGLPKDCLSGTSQGSVCKATSTNTGNAIVQVGSRGCGFATGLSNHYAWGPSVVVEENRATTLFAGCYDPVEECAALGPDFYWDGFECVYAPGSPIIISTTGKVNPYELTSVSDGVLFDINGDGLMEQIGWTAHNSEVAFLALDRDGDGRINNGKELFGNHTRSDARNGFQALSLMAAESNGGVFRGSVSGDDPLFARLLLWVDRNHNGVSEKHELRPAAELLSDIGVAYVPTKIVDEHGNRFAYRGWAQRRTAPGRNKPKDADEDVARSIEIWDVYFKVQ